MPILNNLVKSGDTDSVILSFLSPPRCRPNDEPMENIRGVKMAIFFEKLQDGFHLLTEMVYGLNY